MKYKRIVPVIAMTLMAGALALGVSMSIAYAKDVQDSPNDANEVTTQEASDGSTSSDTTATDDSANTRTGEQERERIKEQIETRIEQAKQETETAREKMHQVEDRLKGARLRSCEARRDGIQRIMQNAGKRGQDRINLFSTIAQKVEAFYVNKGKTLANYGQLVAAVDAKEAAAQSAVDAVKNADTSFDCNGTNPKATISLFKAELKAQMAALKAYRSAVKDLIVGVKSVQSTATNEAGN